MKLSEHVEHIRSLIYKAFNNQFSRLGVGANKLVEIEKIPADLLSKRQKIEVLIDSHTGETGSYIEARKKALDELTFTLFNRLASVKVMEAHQLFPPMVTKEAEHGDRSFGHKMWLEQNPDMRSEELEGLREYFKHEFNQLGTSIPLFSKEYPYALLPYVIEFNEIIDAFNAVAQDNQVDDAIWQSDDILGWLYESYNNVKKQAHKDSGDKTEYNKVSLQSQVYTPRWVVEFLVHNSLGKLYLEMHPDSEIKDDFKIANAPQKRIREPKPLHEIKLIDPASGSGNFLLYAFEFFYKLYQDQIDNFGADYDEDDIPQLIIENNLHGVDLDDRAIQLAQLGLWIKAKQKRRSTGSLKFNVVSSDFFLPEYTEVQHIFESDQSLSAPQKKLIQEVWTDLQQAYKFGSLVKVGEKVKLQVQSLYDKQKRGEMDLFLSAEITQYEAFEKEFFTNLETAVAQYATQQGNSFLTDKTKDAITFLRLITQRYDVATANPPYTSRRDYGSELKNFVESNYKEPLKANVNLYACFIQRLNELLNEKGKLAMLTPMTFMFISTYQKIRELMLSKYKINYFVQFGFGGMFSESVDPAFFVLEKGGGSINHKANFTKLDTYFDNSKKQIFEKSLNDFIHGIDNEHNFSLKQSNLLEITGSPFIYWISDDFREKFTSNVLDDNIKVVQGLATGDNSRFLRYWWEIDSNNKENLESWIPYAKGGTFNKWAGNLWLRVNWVNNGYAIKNFTDSNGKLRSRPQNEKFYFEEGITYSASGRGGYAFRALPSGSIFDVGGSSMFPVKSFKNTSYVLALLNSKLVFYIANCLNPTANIQVGDLQRVPFVVPKKEDELFVTKLANENINLTKEILTYEFFEHSYENSGLLKFNDIRKNISQVAASFTEYIISRKVLILINEFLINKRVINIYNLNDYDKDLVIADQGEDVCNFPVSNQALTSFLNKWKKDLNLEALDYITDLPSDTLEISKECDFTKLFKANSQVEDFCETHKIHPIELWFKFTNQNKLPLKFIQSKSSELIFDAVSEVLKRDEDGIVPLIPNTGESILIDRLREILLERGISDSQFDTFDSVLAKKIDVFINTSFFKGMSDSSNMFSYLPKTPFIWHLTSGPEQGFDCYIIIYKWNRDKLLSIRSRYIEQRERSLENRQSDLRAKSVLSASEQNELDKIYKQLKEIESFKQRIDELLAEGYNPVLDDGVGKNIAPLQKKKMIAYEVLNAGQLKKYLNADW